ncbi:MAG: hypothetical protein R3Y04_06820 [Rikenellaceae bacterium]
MRKLERKSLDELAQKMPLIKESEQAQFVGGYKYYDASGNYMGTLGSSNEIRLLYNNLLDLNSIVLAGDCTETNNTAYNMSISYSDMSSMQKETVISTILKETDATFSGDVSFTYSSSSAEIGSSESGNISINVDHYVLSDGNYYNIKSALVYGITSATTIGGNSEYEALYAQVYHPDFENCTETMKAAVISQFNNSAAKLGKPLYGE